MKLVDQFGKPFASQELREIQTARLLALQNEVAGHPSRGLTPARLNSILEAAENGDLVAQHELFQDIEERDGHVFSELSKRKRSVIKLPWDIVPPRNPSKEEVTATAYVKELLQDMSDFEDLCFDLLDAISHGFSAIELEWQRIGKDWTIECAHHRPQSWFQLDPQTRSKLHLRDATPDGQRLQPFGWILHTHKAKSGYISRCGLGRILVWPYIFKHFSVGDLAEFLDIYGLPLRIGKYPSNALPEEKATLWQAVAGIGHNAAGVIPQSMTIEFEEAAKGSEKPFETMISWCERTQSKAITGSTLTSEAGSTGMGSGLADVHNEVRLDIRDSDCKQLAGTITRDLIYPLLAFNKGWTDVRRCPRIVFDVVEGEDIKTFSDSLPKLVGIGMRIPQQWAHERLRIPQPDANEPILSAQPKADQAPAGKASDKTAKLAALKSDIAGGFADQDAIDAAIESLSTSLQPQAEAWLKPAIDALIAAKTPEAALNLLASDNPLTADAVLADAVGHAMFIVELVGADSVLDELQD
jgi:phage gp29-like protein